MQNFIGKDGFIWWLGVIENRDDPLNLGRVQVRIFGWHTGDMSLIPTSDLPWALPMNSPNQSMTAAAPLVGDYCFGFFSDGMSGQSPYLMGVFPGIPQNGPNPSQGFSEGDFYPVGEPTTSRLYRNDNTGDTTITFHDSNVDAGVATADGGSWDEPKSQYATKPPYNRVTETVAGHIFEMDDTPGAERIMLNHKKDGLTFFEIAPDGSKVTKVKGNNFEIYMQDNNIHVMGVCNITVDGNANLYVKGDLTQKVDGNVKEEVGGNVDQTVSGTVTATASSWTFNGPLQWNGNINVNGGITSTGDVVGGGISLDGHVHGGVKAGGDKTAPPS